MENSENSVVIELEKASGGLGFNIVGGTDNPHIPGDAGIFISKIKADSTAERDGRLKIGDKILKVNDEMLIDLTHEAAVSIFRKAKGRVKLEVELNAERRILEQPAKLFVDAPVKPSPSSTATTATASTSNASSSARATTTTSTSSTSITSSSAPAASGKEQSSNEKTVLHTNQDSVGDCVDTPKSGVSLGASQTSLVDDVPKTPKKKPAGDSADVDSGASSASARGGGSMPRIELLAALVGVGAIGVIAFVVYRRYVHKA